MNCILSDPDFCESGAFGAGLTALDGPKLASLLHVCILIHEAQGSLRCSAEYKQTSQAQQVQRNNVQTTCI